MIEGLLKIRPEDGTLYRQLVEESREIWAELKDMPRWRVLRRMRLEDRERDLFKQRIAILNRAGKS